MADIARYSTSSTPNPVTEYRQSVNTPDYEGQPNVLINPNLSAVAGQPMRYWKHIAGEIQLMTQGERDAVDAAIATSTLNSARNGAKDQIVGTIPLPILLRALADILKDEINVVRGWTASFKTEVAAASNLADLKTRVATLPTLGARTLAQLKTAINSRIDSGGVDS